MGSRLYVSKGEIKMQTGIGDTDALKWLVLPALFNDNTAELKQQVAEVSADANKAFAGMFQLFLQGQLGGYRRSDVVAMTNGLQEPKQVALRGPIDVFLVMAGLTFAEACVAKFGNPQFASMDDPALIEYINKCKAAETELLSVPMNRYYVALANWCGGNGGLVKEDYHSVYGLIDFVGGDLAELVGWDNNNYLNPDKITDMTSGQAVNTQVAMIKLKSQSPWCAYWIQERVFGKALNKQAQQQRTMEKAQNKIIEKVAKTTDQLGATLGDAVDALNKAMKNLGGLLGFLGDWIVPIVVGAGALWLLFTFAPAIVRKGGQTTEALAEVRAKRKRLPR